jgi:dipeptidyl aminopeptidase/acylaminoacyl peptidase
MESSPIQGVAEGGFRGRPALVLHGAKDRRIPLVYAKAAVEQLRLKVADVTVRVWPEEDHFLLFSQDEAVLKEIGGWMDRSRGSRSQ